MATGPDPSLLLARAVGAAARAAAMGQVATAPEMRAHIGLVELACRDVRAWLQPPPTEAAELLQVDAAIGAHIKRLDDLEERLRANAGAKP